MQHLELHPLQLQKNIGLYNHYECGSEIPLKCSGRKNNNKLNKY